MSQSVVHEYAMLEVILGLSGTLVLARRLRAGPCDDAIHEACPRLTTCGPRGSAACVSIAVLKVPRTGSTWFAKELRAFAGVSIEFEPFTDSALPPQNSCGGRFFTQAVIQALTSRLRCVTREFRSQPCYWAWQHCNSSRLQPRPSPPVRPVLVGFLLNPMYTPGVKWDVAMTKAGAKLIWLRRTNLIKMALSDLRRLATAAARRTTPTESNQTSSMIGTRLERIEPRTLLAKVNTSLVSQASFPAAISLEHGLLVLYEDLQAHRGLVLHSIFAFLGLDTQPAIAAELARQMTAQEAAAARYLHLAMPAGSVAGRLAPSHSRRSASSMAAQEQLPSLMRPGAPALVTVPGLQMRGEAGEARRTHWRKASEDVCDDLPKGNCNELRAALHDKPCLHAQLNSREQVTWSFPNRNGTLSLSTLDGHCVQLPSLLQLIRQEVAMQQQHEQQQHEQQQHEQQQHEHQVAAVRCRARRIGRRSLFDLYGTRFPEERSLKGRMCGRLRTVKLVNPRILPFSLSISAGFPQAALGSSRTDFVSSVNESTLGGSKRPVLQLESKRPTRVPTPRMVRPWQRMTYSTPQLGRAGSHEAAERTSPSAPPRSGKASSAAAAAAAVRFVIFSRQRSASTTFVGLLNLHPNVTCRWESFSNSHTASKMRHFLGITNRSDQLANIPEFMARFWTACPSRACGFKLLTAQIRPVERIPQIFKLPAVEAPGHSEGAAGPARRVLSAVPVRRILLERRDVDAEFESWRHAQETGNWGTTPEAQARIAAAREQGANSSELQLGLQPGCRGCDADAVAKKQAMVATVGLQRFAAQHHQWFRLARELTPAREPLLHIFTEDLIADIVRCNQTMQRVYLFLDLPPLINNCDLAKVPTELSCDIMHDPRCSLEKYQRAASIAMPSGTERRSSPA